jgi:hypothetical protein
MVEPTLSDSNAANTWAAQAKYWVVPHIAADHINCSKVDTIPTSISEFNAL